MAKIYIDIGHGGRDSTGVDTGTSGIYNGKTYYENEVNLNIGLEVKKTLESYGHTVVTERTENVNFGPLVGSYGRADSNLINSASYCKNTDCDCMVSIHNNAYSSANASGYVLIYKAGSEATNDVKVKSKALCDNINAQIKKVLPMNDVRTTLMSNGQDYYGILRLHDKVGVLIECGFMTNSSDMKKLVVNYKDIGKSIADGINTFVGGAIIDPDDDNDCLLKVEELENKIKTLEKEVTSQIKTINSLEKKNKELTNKLNKALEFDVDANGATNEEDAVYLLKHIIDPKKFPIPKQ